MKTIQRNSAPSFNEVEFASQQRSQQDEDESFFKRLKLQATYPGIDQQDLELIIQFREQNQSLKQFTQLCDTLTSQQLNVSYFDSLYKQIKLMVKPSNAVYSSLLSVLCIFAGLESDFIPLDFQCRRDIVWNEIQNILRTPNKVIYLLKHFEKYIYEGQLDPVNIETAELWLEEFEQRDTQEQIHPTAQKLCSISREAIECYNEYHNKKAEYFKQRIILIQDETQNGRTHVTASFSEISNQIGGHEEELPPQIQQIQKPSVDEQPNKTKVQVAVKKQVKSKQDKPKPVTSKVVNHKKTASASSANILQCNRQSRVQKPAQPQKHRSPNVPKTERVVSQQRKTERSYQSGEKDLQSPIQIRERIETDSRELSKITARESYFKWQVEREAKKIKQWIQKDTENKEYEYNRSQSQRNRILEERRLKQQRDNDNESKKFVIELRAQHNFRFRENENIAYKKYLLEYTNKYNEVSSDQANEINILRNQLAVVNKELQNKSNSLGRIQQKAQAYPEKSPFKEARILNELN